MLNYSCNYFCQLQLQYNYFLFLARHNTINIDCIFPRDVDGVSIKDIFSIL